MIPINEKKSTQAHIVNTNDHTDTPYTDSYSTHAHSNHRNPKDTLSNIHKYMKQFGFHKHSIQMAMNSFGA